MVPLLEGLLARGAQLYVTTCNPNTVRDEATGHLRAAGADVETWHAMPQDAWRLATEHALDWGPTHLCEMGAGLTAALHQRETHASQVRASLEATGSGIARLVGLKLCYPHLQLARLAGQGGAAQPPHGGSDRLACVFRADAPHAAA